MVRIVRWITVAVVVTAVFGSMYVLLQQVERQGADDAPERLASQIAGHPGTSSPSVDLRTSETAFFVVYDTDDHPVSGTARLDGALPTVPHGILDTARRTGGDHVTWQPRDGLRFATVARLAGDRVVIAGQSLAPSENRTDQLGLLVLLAWLVTLAVVVAGALVERFLGDIERIGPPQTAR